MLSSLKVLFLGKPFWGSPWRAPKFCPNNCLTNNFLICEFQLSMLSSSQVLFLGAILRGLPPEGLPTLVKIIVSPITFYIINFKFLCWAVQKLRFGKRHFGVFPPLRTPKFGQNNCLTYNFLHSEFQLSMLSSSKVSFLEGQFGVFSPL